MDTQTMRPNIDIPNRIDGEVADYADDRDLNKQDAYSELLDHTLEFQPLSDAAKEALIEYLNQDHFNGHEPEHAEHLVETGMTTLIKDYVPDSPGYRGDLILAMYGYPATYTLYTYEDGEVTGEIDREAQN